MLPFYGELLPLPGGKRDSDWGYAWIPLFAPLVGSILVAMTYHAFGQGGIDLPSLSSIVNIIP